MTQDRKTTLNALRDVNKGFLLSLMFVMLVLMSSLVIAKEAPLSSKTQVLKVIDEYQQYPISERGFKLASQIVEYAENASEVIVEVNPDTTPWLMNERLPSSMKGALLAAYVSGNIKPQLTLDIKQAHHCEGAYEVQRVLDLIVNPNAAEALAIAKGLNKRSMSQFACIDIPINTI